MFSFSPRQALRRLPTQVHRRVRARTLSLRVDTLEERAIPAAGLDMIYQVAGQINRVGETARIDIPIPATDFNLPAGGRVVLGFAFEPAQDRRLDPAAFGLKASGGAAATVSRKVGNLPGEKTALTVARVRPGTLSDALKGAAKTTGAFELSVYLAGDVNGDARVDTFDVSTIQSLIGVKRGDVRYRLEADADRNGTISIADQKLAEKNLGIVNSAPRPERRLHEGPGLLTQTTVPVALGQATGSQVLRVPVRAHFDAMDVGAAAEDTFLIYLVDPNNPQQTLLDRGTPGTALFSLPGNKAEMATGRVRYDGTTVEIDVTGLAESSGLLVFQMVNSDSDTGSSVRAGPVASRIDPAGSVGPSFSQDLDLADAGPAMNLGLLTNSTTVRTQLQNVRVDAAGNYSAELVLRNEGPAIGRQIAVVFPALPAGAQLVNPSGTDGTGNPYVNFQSAIPAGGLAAGQGSRPILLTFTDPGLLPLRLVPQVLGGGLNNAPILDPIVPLSMFAGGRLSVPIVAADPDGDSVSLSVAGSTLPTGGLSGSTLSFAPTPTETGVYQFDVIASDGVAQARRTVELTVAADPDTSTRLSGLVRDSAGNPLNGVLVEFNGITANTAADGSFQLVFAGILPAAPLIVLGEQIASAIEYPLVALDPTQLLGRSPFASTDNVILRPIYLTAIDAANGVIVDPGSDTVVTTPELPGATLIVPAGSTPYTGPLALTEVTATQLRGAIPEEFAPDIVVRIDPSGPTASVDFNPPAVLILPNRAGWAPNLVLDLWTLDSLTGQITDVGDGQVALDGALIQTIGGGVPSTGLYFFLPRPEDAQDPAQIVFNQSTAGVEEVATVPVTSEVELHSGTLIERHDLVTYQSVGQTRGLSLRYDSLRLASRRSAADLSLGADGREPD